MLLQYPILLSESTTPILIFGSHYVQHTNEPFALTIAGERFYIILSPEDLRMAYRNESTIEFDMQDVFMGFDGSSNGLQKLRATHQ